MAEDHSEIPSTTPLDLLINAIAGSTDFDYLSNAQEGDGLRSVQPVDENDSLELHADGYGAERPANTLSAVSTCLVTHINIESMLIGL